MQGNGCRRRYANSIERPIAIARHRSGGVFSSGGLGFVALVVGVATNSFIYSPRFRDLYYSVGH